MITETKDAKTGIIRFEINTVNPDACRKEIESSGFVKEKILAGDVIRYLVSFRGVDLDVRSTPTRTIVYGLNRFAMTDFIETVKGDELGGTGWIYDDSKRGDYQN